jgi:hypothetical protein
MKRSIINNSPPARNNFQVVMNDCSMMASQKMVEGTGNLLLLKFVDETAI